MSVRPPSRRAGPPRRIGWMRAAGAPGTHRSGRAPPGLKVATVLVGVLLALLIGAIVFFTVGERTGIATFAGIVALAFLLTALTPAPLLWGGLIAEVGVAVWAGWYIADEARGVLTALSTTEGPVAVADADSLAAAEERIGAANAETAFRLELHEDEVTAVIQQELADTDQPLRSIEVNIVDGPTPSEGTLAFTGQVKTGGYQSSRHMRVDVSGGAH